MSCSTLISVIPNKSHKHIIELPNSWGTAPIIWDELYNKYIGDNGNFLLYVDKLIKLWDNKSIPISYRALLLFTYDRTYVLKKDFNRFADDINMFLNDFKTKEGNVNHWPYISKYIRENNKLKAIGLYSTSISECPFCGEWNEKKEKHIESPKEWCNIYEELDKI